MAGFGRETLKYQRAAPAVVTTMSEHQVFRFDDFQVDPETWRLTRAGREIHLEPVVLKLLIYLISNRE